MHRLAIEYLKAWKLSEFRSSLLLRGARQVGKTWIARELAKEFDNFFEINFEESPEFIGLFSENKGKPQKILDAIVALTDKQLRPGSTLLFLDEIQECPDAFISLRYFKEKMPQLHVIGAGSLIEFVLKEVSFPVGRIESLYIFPLNFTEFLRAKGNLALLKYLSPKKLKALDSAIHNKLMDEFKLFTALGGLPEVIEVYLKTNNLEMAQAVQQKLVSSYRNDFNKYASRSEIKYVKGVFDSIPLQLGQKFMFSRALPEARARDLRIGLSLLVDAGLAYCCWHSSGNRPPLAAEIKENRFKLFMFDTGLVQRLLGRQLKTLIHLRKENDFAIQGNICESIVAQELISLTKKNDSPRLYYWLREAKSAQAELDFLLQHDDQIIPIEVKRSGTEKYTSLKIFCEEKKKNIAIVISDQKYEESSIGSQASTKLIKLPYYWINQLDTVLRQK